MTQFDELLPFILANEGVSATNPTGFANIPGDTGGVTNWGISQTEWSKLQVRYSEFSALPADVRSLTQEQASLIYRVAYYSQVFDELPASAALICFDCNVNEGLGVRILQRALGVVDDGNFGPVSQQALRLALRNIPTLCEELLWQRLANYDSIAKGSFVNQQFLAKFWVPRLIAVRKQAKGL